MIVRVDVLPIVLELRRVIVAEVIGGYHGQAQLGRWWLPSDLLGATEQPGVLVGGRVADVGKDRHLGLVVAGAVTGGEPALGAPVSGFAARTLGELPDQVGFWHRDDVSVLVARYEKLRG